MTLNFSKRAKNKKRNEQSGIRVLDKQRRLMNLKWTKEAIVELYKTQNGKRMDRMVNQFFKSINASR